FFFFQAEDGIRDDLVTGVQTCALPIFKEVIRLCKAQGKTVVMGGPYASMGLNDAIEADHVFVGEVETTFPGFLEDFEHGEAKARSEERRVGKECRYRGGSALSE